MTLASVWAGRTIPLHPAPCPLHPLNIPLPSRAESLPLSAQRSLTMPRSDRSSSKVLRTVVHDSREGLEMPLHPAPPRSTPAPPPE